MDLPASMQPVDVSNKHGFENLEDLLSPSKPDHNQTKESPSQKAGGVARGLQPPYPDGVNFRDYQSNDVDLRPKKSYGRGLARAVGGQCAYQITGRKLSGESLTNEMLEKLQRSFPAATNDVGNMQEEFRSGYNLIGTQQDLNPTSVATAGKLGQLATTKYYPQDPLYRPRPPLQVNVVTNSPQGYFSQMVASRSPATQMRGSMEPLVSQPENIGWTQPSVVTHSGIGIPTQNSAVTHSGFLEENGERVNWSTSQSAQLSGELSLEEYSQFLNQKEKSLENQLDAVSGAEMVNSHKVVSLETQGDEPSSDLKASLMKPVQNKEGGGAQDDPEGSSDDPFAKECAVCSRNPADSCFYPCMEFAFCRMCAHKFFEKYSRCPYCREKIERIVSL